MISTQWFLSATPFLPHLSSAPVWASRDCSSVQKHPAGLVWGSPSISCSVYICSSAWSTSSPSLTLVLALLFPIFFYFLPIQWFFPFLPNITIEAPPASQMGAAVASGVSTRAIWKWLCLAWGSPLTNATPAAPLLPASSIDTQHNILLWHPKISLKLHLYEQKEGALKKISQ